MKINRRRLSIGLATAIVVLVGGAARAQTALDTITANGVIRVAVPTDFPPYGFVGPDMAPQGLDVDMANHIAEQLGVTAELIPVTTANRVPYLQTNKADLVISTLGKNAERELVIDFTAAYSPFFIGVFGPQSMTVETAADLSGKSIAVTRGSVDDTELTAIAPEDVEIRRFEDNAATISAFVAGQTELVATSAQVASTMMTNNPQLGAEYKFLLKDSPNFIGVAKGEEALRDKVNEIIAAAKADGWIDAQSEKWLGRTAGDLPL